MRYGSLEYAYAAPIASALADNSDFQLWVLEKTKFGAIAKDARLLHEEMADARKATSWWRSHYTEKCRCEGCSGQETDLLAIYEAPHGLRFALHFEVKQPTDRFTPGGKQALNYRKRAECWTATPPRSILPHEQAATVLLCSQFILQRFSDEALQFDAAITFEEIAEKFPEIALPTAK